MNRPFDRIRRPGFYLPIAILLAGFVGAALMVGMRQPVETRRPEAPPPLVRVTTALPGDLQLSVTAHGEVTPRTESSLVAQASGQVVYTSDAFASGGFFEKGDELVRIDPRDYELAVARSKAQVAQAELQLAREQEESEIAAQEWDRVGTGEANALALRQPQLAEARAVLASAAAALKQAQINLERTSVRAPYAGRIRSKSVDIGQFVNPGTTLARIYAVDYAEIRLPMPDSDIAYLDLPFDFRGASKSAQGPAVSLRTEFAGKWHTWEGRIVRVEGELDPRTRMINLVARVADPYGRGGDPTRPPLVVGLFVAANVSGLNVSDVVVLPRSVMRGRDEVLVVTPDNRLYFRTVEVLKTNTETVIIQSGLKRGERVCLSPMDAVVDGMKVRVFESDQIPDGSEKGAPEAMDSPRDAGGAQ